MSAKKVVESMAWISVHESLNGSKLRRLFKALGCSKFEATGILVFLWFWGLNNADSTGRIQYADVEDIRRELIIVDRTPVAREWSETVESGTSTNNQAIYAESKESIGFNVGMNCSAQIYSEEDAVKFLYCYNNKTLSDIIDSEIRARVESNFVETCAKYTMNEILAKKAEIMDYVRDDVTSYFAERGITITVLGMKDGIEYDDPSVQTAINASFVAERNAEAQRVNNETAIAKAQAEGEAEIISAEATAKANRLLAESITDGLVELKKIERWNGQLPKATGAEASIIDIGE